ncbi:MAG: hypothetical protein SGILL_000121 [Bacillariaceae sp.]
MVLGKNTKRNPKSSPFTLFATMRRHTTAAANSRWTPRNTGAYRSYMFPATPTGKMISPNQKRRGLWIAFVLLVAALLAFSSTKKEESSEKDAVETVVTQQKSPGPQVCSHQLLNPPPLDPKSKPPPDGSLQAMNALWSAAKISCFDVDVVTLQDGTLLATHPRRLASALGEIAAKDGSMDVVSDEKSVHQNAYPVIKNALLSMDMAQEGEAFPFPLLDTELLPLYAKLVQGSPAFFGGSVSNRRLQGPLLNLDLKQGPHLTKEKLLSLVETIHKLGLQDYVAICVTPLNKNQAKREDNTNAALDMLTILHEHNSQQTSTHKPIPLGLVLRDLVPEDQVVSHVRQQVQKHSPSIRLLVPSFKFPEKWYRNLHQEEYRDDDDDDDSSKASETTTSINPLAQLPMTAWTIDTQQDYEYASRMNVSSIVANRPLDFL